MNADVIADGIVLAVGRLCLGGFAVMMLCYVASIALDVWKERRRARLIRRAAKRAQRPVKPFSFESYIGMGN